MNDTKNILLAWVSSVTSVFAAVETGTLITIVSAVVLPVVFFSVGKTVDVLLQIYFRRTDKAKRFATDITDKERIGDDT